MFGNSTISGITKIFAEGLIQRRHMRMSAFYKRRYPSRIGATMPVYQVTLTCSWQIHAGEVVKEKNSIKSTKLLMFSRGIIKSANELIVHSNNNGLSHVSILNRPKKNHQFSTGAKAMVNILVANFRAEQFCGVPVVYRKHFADADQE